MRNEKNVSGSVKKVDWLRVRAVSGENALRVKERLSTYNLHTVCESASCPNVGKCWEHGHATIMILGDLCTRGCKFCGVTSKIPCAPDEDEPRRVAAAVRDTGLKDIVITSVTRDDLSDGGAKIWRNTIEAIRELNPDIRLEVLVPDFMGNISAIDAVIGSHPDIFGHNMETVPSLYKKIRIYANWERSISLLKRATEKGLVTKTGFMVGLGETNDELYEAFKMVHDVGVRILYVGQYLSPTKEHHPVMRYVSPEEFSEMEQHARDIGFDTCLFGPLVRSSIVRK